MRTSLLRSVALVCALALTAAACGGGTDSADADLVAALESSAESDALDLDGLEVDTNCMAESLVNAMGGAANAEEQYGVTVDVVNNDSDFDLEFERADAETFVDGLWECGDMMEAMAMGMTSEGAPEEEAKCLAEELDEDAVKQAMAAEFMNAADGATVTAEAEEAMFASILDAMGTCNVSLDSLGG